MPDDDDLQPEKPAPQPEEPAKRARIPVPDKKPARPKPPRSRVNTVIGDYEVDGELGRGGMGVVYRARQMRLNRQVALKMLTGHYGADELQRFLAEAQTAAALHHTNIVHIYEVGEIEGSPFFSMEFVEGGSLADKLRKEKLPPRAIAEFLMPVARAMHFAHQHGVVHRDMKPHNILIDSEGVPKIADFGIAKRMDGDSALTVSGAIIGTPAYMAPEQAGGASRHVGPGADIYALGVILYEMLTGRPPFISEESETPLHIRVHTEDVTSPAWHNSDIPRELEVICMKCLQKDPRDRYNSAAAFAEDLRRYLDDEPILAKPPSRIVKTVKWVRRNPWKFGLRAALLLAVIASGWRLWQWEAYERDRYEYAASVEYTWNGLEPTHKLRAEDTKRRALSLRLTRRGRFGPITLVEILNARGHPAVTRRLAIADPIPLLTEGIIDAQPFSERLPETTRFQADFVKGRISEMKGWDRTGCVNWRMIYDHGDPEEGKQYAQFSPGDGGGEKRVKRARFANLRGFDQNLKAASFLEFERDGTGQNEVIRFYNAVGEPAQNGERVFGYRLLRDISGRPIRVFNIDQNAKHMANRMDLVAWETRYDAGGAVASFKALDGGGQPAAWGKVAEVRNEYDPHGNPIKTTRFDSQGQPLISENGDWTFAEFKRNDTGEIVYRKFSGLLGSGEVKTLSETFVNYDEFGHPADIRFSGIEKWHTAYKNDANGNILEETFLGLDGKPIDKNRGYATKRSAYKVTNKGLIREDTYFSANEEKTYNVAGYHRLIDEFSPTGVLVRQTLDEHDPAKYKYYRYVSEPTYDGESRLRFLKTRFEDKEGNLAVDADLMFNAMEETYNERGWATETWQFGWQESEGASVWKKETEWYDTGDIRSIAWQAYDENRSKLKKLTNLNPAYYIDEYSKTGLLTRKFQSDYDESKKGYFSREIVLHEGKLERITYRRSDGSEIKDMRTVVHEILPDAQPVVREKFRIGDQLVSANGVPVKTAFTWTFGSDFAGGWIEVLRDGITVRIEGLEGGQLGLLLEDVAPGATK